MKHHAPGWKLLNHGNAHLTWTTPTGRRIDVIPHEADDDVGRDIGAAKIGPAPPSGTPPDDEPPF